MKSSDLTPSKYLKKSDCDDGDLILTIKSAKLETMPDSGEERGVLYFKEIQRGLVLNITTRETLDGLFGDDTDDWQNKKVELYADHTVRYLNKVVGGLRLRAIPTKSPAAAKSKKAKAAPQPAADEGDFDDAIPM